MTIEELSKYYRIRQEIMQIENHLKEVDATILGSPNLDGMIKGNSPSSPVEKVIIKREKLLNKLNNKKIKLLDEQIRIENYLDEIDDENIRIIIRERFINLKNWEEIGELLHYDRTTPYYQLKQYLKKRGNKNGI